MQDPTSTTALLVRADDMLGLDNLDQRDRNELGRIEQKLRCEGGESLTANERAIYAAARRHPRHARTLMEVAHEYEEYLEREIQKNGGTIITERTRWQNGVCTCETIVQHFPPPASAPVSHASGHRGGAQRRPTGRSGAARRASGSRSGADPGDDGESSEPPLRRLCEFCNRDIPPVRASQARYCSQKHADRDRKRRERTRYRKAAPRTISSPGDSRYRTFGPGEKELLLAYLHCRCNGSHILAPPDDPPGPRCIKCGRLREAMS